MKIKEIQEHLVKSELDGWLLADFHCRNDVAASFLNLPDHLTRRSFYFIPVSGEPVGLVAHIEKTKFSHLPGRLVPFAGYIELELKLREFLNGAKRIAMEYAPSGRLPYIGLVDAGTIELVRDMGIEIVSSADLVAGFLAKMSDRQIEAHRAAARCVIDAVGGAFDLISAALKSKRRITEWEVCRFILDEFEKHQMDTEHMPNCSVGPNAGNPHYEPTAQQSSEITAGQVVLIDLWAKERNEHGVFADITQMAFAGTASDIPRRLVEQFSVLCQARDAAVQFLIDNINSREVRGAEVDDVCRKVIVDAGIGDYFTHRTGHSIYQSVHGPGPNIDNLETEDSRVLQSGHLFSIEPGVYFEDYGLRTEINAFVTPTGIEIATLPLQTEIRPLL